MDLTSLYVVIAGLTLMNVFQLFYWSRQVHVLIDKVMSKNYAEYVQSKSLLTPSPGQGDFPHEVRLPADDEVLNEVNKLFGA